jgi:3-deoxy-7-phosphoheptulonate synthase
VESYKPKPEFYIIAGPCSVETEDQINTISDLVASCGATHLRGGVFRAGTYPGDKFGWIDWGLIKAARDAAHRNGLKNIVEVLEYSERTLDRLTELADCFQIGCRAMQHYQLLKEVAQRGKTVFLKRHPGSSIDEWLGSAEYILKYGGHPVLIERGTSTHMSHCRWDLSISAIPAVHAINPMMPVVVDGSHGTGRRDLVEPMTLAGIAAGADGMLVEVHTDPEKSLSDADQAIRPEAFLTIMEKAMAIRKILKSSEVKS